MYRYVNLRVVLIISQYYVILGIFSGKYGQTVVYRHSPEIEHDGYFLVNFR